MEINKTILAECLAVSLASSIVAASLTDVFGAMRSKKKEKINLETERAHAYTEGWIDGIVTGFAVLKPNATQKKKDDSTKTKSK